MDKTREPQNIYKAKYKTYTTQKQHTRRCDTRQKKDKENHKTQARHGWTNDPTKTRRQDRQRQDDKIDTDKTNGQRPRQKHSQYKRTKDMVEDKDKTKQATA